MTPREAFFAARETVAAEDAAGRVAAEMVARIRPASRRSRPARSCREELVDALREAAAGGTRLVVLRRSRARLAPGRRPPVEPGVAICYNSA